MVAGGGRRNMWIR